MNKKIRNVMVGLVIGACTLAALAGCTEDSESKIKTTPLAIPTNVKVNVGEDAYDLEQVTVTFDAVENASKYYVYAYENGAEKAKVTITDTTTGELPNDLTPGTEYNISVVAVSDSIYYTNSNGSEAVKFTLEEWEVRPLDAVKNISMDWSGIDAENAIYPTVKFSEVSGKVSHYNVQIFAADASGNKTSEMAATYFQVPAGFGGEYMLTSTAFGNLVPGYYAVDVYAVGDGTYFTDSEVATGKTAWTGVSLPDIELKAEEAGNGGVTVEIENHKDYYLGMTFTFEAYSDEACTNLVASKDVTYSSRESFGNVSYTNSTTFEVVEGAATGDKLSKDQTYYFKATIKVEQPIYKADAVSSVKSVTTTKTGTGSSGGGNSDFPGGGGGGGDITVKFDETYTFASDAATFDFNIGEHNLLKTTATKKETPTAGSTYSYVLESKDTGAPFKLDCTLELLSDGTVKFHLGAVGPLSETNKTGTWTEEDGVITVIIEG